MDKPTICVLGFAVGLLFALVTHGLYDCNAKKEMKREAIERGHAEYVMDPKTGESEWRWKSE